jgi:hypothetical protein
MAKRLRVQFNKPLGSARIEEDGQAKPCASGVGWVNKHTLQTLAKLDIQRTDAKGRLLPTDTKARRLPIDTKARRLPTDGKEPED